MYYLVQDQKYQKYDFFKEEIDDIIKVVEMYPISMEEIRQIAHLTANINKTHGPGYVTRLLIKKCKEMGKF